jgi:hypothetical protein
VTARAGVLLALAAMVTFAPSVARALGEPSPLTLAVMEGIDPPRLVLAQRAIDRSWGLSDDSTYVEVPLGDWKSEGLGVAMSAAVPGTGQVYAGESSGYLFLVAEVAGWVSHAMFHSSADQKRGEMVDYAGVPTDTLSGWSAARWQQATGGDPTDLITLYDVDRDAYLRLIETDNRLLSGWEGDATSTRDGYSSIRASEQQYMRSSRYATWAILVNHVLSAYDALRAVRSHNLPLRRDLELRLRGGWHHGQPSVLLTVRRSF